MTKLYKLTTSDHKTRKGRPEETQWGEGITHTASGEGGLCGPGWLHAYTHPLLAVLLNPIHASISDPVLWECDGDVGEDDHGLKVGCTRLTTRFVIDLPSISTERRVRFAILCAKQVSTDAVFTAWADSWLEVKDRTASTAEAAARAAEVAARAAEAAARAGTPLDLIALAEEAVKA